MLNIFENRRVLITGASAGIGLCLTRKVHLAGGDILAVGRRPPGELPEDFPDLAYSAIDLGAPDATAQIIAAAETLDWDTLDYLVLNAGTGRYAGVETEDAASIADTVQVNLAAPIEIAHAFADRLLAGHGKVVLVGSAAHKGSAGFPVYAATKAALNGFARSLRSEWRGRIDVQIIHPGPVSTEMHARAGFDPGWMGKLFLKADDVAEVMARRIASNRSPVTVGYRAVIRMREKRLMRGGG
jgi:short-subunit dehydrogenase